MLAKSKIVFVLIIFAAIVVGIAFLSGFFEKGQAGSVYFSSEPSGAEIWIDGSNTGKLTPATIYNLQEGDHSYALKKKGFVDFSGTFYVRADKGINVPKASLVQIPTQTPPAPVRSPTPVTTATSGKNRIFAQDNKHGDYSYSGVSNYVKGKGWETIELNEQPLTLEYLQRKGVTILYIDHVTIPYSESEIAEIKAFVEQGGGLLLEVGDPRQEFGKELAKVFGITVTEERIGNDYFQPLTVSVSSAHPLMKDVRSFRLYSYEGAGYTRHTVYLHAEPPAYSVLESNITSPYYTIVTAAEYGKGRVVVFSSGFIITEADNSYFLRNALYWLQQEELK